MAQSTSSPEEKSAFHCLRGGVPIWWLRIAIWKISRYRGQSPLHLPDFGAQNKLFPLPQIQWMTLLISGSRHAPTILNSNRETKSRQTKKQAITLHSIAPPQPFIQRQRHLQRAPNILGTRAKSC